MSARFFALLLVAVFAILNVQARGLFGLNYPTQLVSINLDTGVATNVGPGVPVEGIAMELSAIDEKGGLFYIIGYNFTTAKPNLLAISLTTGRVVSNVYLPFAESGFVGVGQALDFDPNTGDVIATGRLTDTGPHAVLRVKPTTGAYTNIAALQNVEDVLGAASIFNPISNIEYMEFAYNDTIWETVVRQAHPPHGVRGYVRRPSVPAVAANGISIDLFGVDMKTGIIDHIIEDSSTGHVLTTIQFDARSKSLVGLGYKNKNGTFQRIFARFDAGAKTWYQVSEITEFLIEAGGVSALDSVRRVLYVIMQKTNVPQSDPFYLVGINIDTGAIASRVVLGAFETCPWSLEFQS